MLDGKVVGGDEEVDGVEVVFGALGKGVRPAYQATGPGPQRTKPTFDVVGFAFLFAARAVGSLGKRGGVGIPIVAAGRTMPVRFGQGSPQIARALQAAISQRPGHDLAGASAERHPQPQRMSFRTDEAPKFIEFEHVAFLAGQERVHEGGQIVRFFPPTTS